MGVEGLTFNRKLERWTKAINQCSSTSSTSGCSIMVEVYVYLTLGRHSEDVRDRRIQQVSDICAPNGDGFVSVVPMEDLGGGGGEGVGDEGEVEGGLVTCQQRGGRN